MTALLYRSTHPVAHNWLGYDFGNRRPSVTGRGQDVGLRFTEWDRGLTWFLPLDIVAAGAGDIEPHSQAAYDLNDPNSPRRKRIPPERYFGSLETSQPPPPIEPPPVVIPDPPPVVVPPVDPPQVVPPVVQPTTYKIKTITRTADFPTVVFFGVAVGLPGKLVSPGGREQPFVTGNKPEFGAGGTEAGAGVVAGDYHLFIGADEFVFSVDGQFTKIEFEPTTDTPPVSDTVVCTGYMDVATAARVLAAANEIARAVVGRDVFRVE